MDLDACRADPIATVCACVEGGVDRVQIRDRRLDALALFEFSSALVAALRGRTPAVEIIVNRRIDIALAIGADGVHLGFDAVSSDQARALLGSEARIGVSTHSLDEVREAAREVERGAVDYVHVAPVFAPRSKPATRPPLGLERLADICAESSCVIAQGGVDAGNVAAIMRTGAAGVAVTGSLLGAADPRRAAARLRSAIDGAALRR